MHTKNKLTLWVDSDLVIFGKDWARQHDRSLSEVVTDYLTRLKASIPKEKSVTPLVREMSGILQGEPSINIRSMYREHLEYKHGRS